VLSRRRVLVGGAALLLASLRGRVARAASRDTPVIDPEVRAAVVKGPARVLVELRLPDPVPSAGPAREQAIATARQAALARLAGTSYRLVRQYASVPLLALEIGPDALQVLEGMGDLVAGVRTERARPPAAPR
jgi:hypothetical protein